MKNKIIKAEILFSRKCNLQCSYCNMPNYTENTLSIEEWKKGMDELKKLDCQFVCFYGAEVMLEFEKLKQVLPYAESIGMDTSIITNGCVPKTREMLKELYDLGGRSLSMSYDMVKQDTWADIKTKKCIETLLYFKYIGNNVRDVAAIATLTRLNFQLLPEMVKIMSDLGIWTFYDLYHSNPYPKEFRYLSKCGEVDSLYDLDNYRNELIEVLETVQTLKNKGYLVHNSESFINELKKHETLDYSWNCSCSDAFPSWLTIDCDGSVMPCVPNYKNCKITVLQSCKQTENNALRPSDISIGDTLIGMDEKTGKFKPTKVIKIHKRKAEFYYNIKCTKAGKNKNLLLTEEHPVRVGNLWIKTKDLKIGQEIQFLTEGELKKLKYWKEVKCAFCGGVVLRRKITLSEEKQVFCSRKCSFKWAGMKNTGCNTLDEYKEWEKNKQQKTLCLCGCGKYVLNGVYFSNHDPETKKKSSKFNKGKWIGDKNPMRCKDSKEKVLKNKNYLESRRRSITKAFQANKNFPTTIEKEFMRIIIKNKLEIDYVGDGQFWVNNLNPDFKIKNQKKVIEVIHSYKRNNGTYKKEREHDFEQEGYKCLVLSKEELNKIDCLEKVNRFIHNGWKIKEISINKTRGDGTDVYNYTCEPHNSYVVNSMLTHNCDDHQIKNPEYKITNISETFNEFTEEMKERVSGGCPGCFWNTHFSAHSIKEGKEDISSYIHGERISGNPAI